MRIRFTKMQGAGNDFVVLDETRGRLGLTSTQYRFLGDRHFGVGADQILSVRASTQTGVDFSYAIHNADGNEVEHCGNGARCFLSFVRARGLTTQDRVRVQTMNRILDLQWEPAAPGWSPELATGSGRVTVDMGVPLLDLAELGFDHSGLQPLTAGLAHNWPLEHMDITPSATDFVALVSMGNPHAVQLVSDIDSAPVASQGPLIATHTRFAQGVNAGFMQIVNRKQIRLRVFERGAGETLACGTGACAAVVVGVLQGLLDSQSQVQVHMRGGVLGVAWAGGNAPVLMSGPATVVFEGEIELPDG